LTLANSELIRNVHNSFARPEMFEEEESKHEKKQGEAFHFISYVPIKGSVYELDGLKSGPILLCRLTFRRMRSKLDSGML